jgi:Helix-turn-helix domain
MPWHPVSGKSVDYAAVRSGPNARLRITADTASSAVCGAPHTAEFERDLIRSRTGEGRERAKARGVKMGRKPKLTPHQRAKAIKRKDSGEAVREIARSFNVHHATISRLGMRL